MVGGIVAEYNPFHNGHLYHIKKTKEHCDTLVVALSPDVCQRGSFSSVSKYSRAAAAIEAGADLVIEIPSVAVLTGAKNFAVSAVGLLESVGVDVLSFGSETGNKEFLFSALSRLSEAEKRGIIADEQKSGKSYPRIMGEVIGNIGANDILALEYLKAKNKKTDVLVVKRESVEHDSPEEKGSFASASYIREKGVENCSHLIPDFAFDLFKNEKKIDEKQLEEAMLSFLKRLSKDDIKKAPSVSEGLENRIYSAIKEAKSVEEAITLVKTKRYTHARLRRIFMCLFLGIKEEDINLTEYIRVLALNEKGAALLKKAKKESKIPIVTSLKEAEKISKNAEKEAFITDFRLFFCGEKAFLGEDYRYSPKIHRKNEN